MTLAEIVVDGRGLEHPEPLERVLAALDELQPGQQLRFLIHRQPYPLYDILHRHHYRYKVTEVTDGNFEILISPP
ncbi:DUF2249 domain-containing protein [Candidatus Contendibacter odensensis]|uniref:DUF2249 domain-containing protein n=1 Tax=Candidatus Contendobacter odensis Run_B_J11 TaxID=1400861 RepID=A0A7U7J476_9GAMM|nr:DUF2249 domain-containing protein [Candidatus Contendobacter odensis]CDH45071.1 conserved hypothetical protein [Candidatus Contendobacter odensis Run_B_J11]